MKKINIQEKNASLLSATITEVVNFYAKNNKIDCIYMTCFLSGDNQEKEDFTVELVLIYNDSSYENNLRKINKKLNSLKERTGIKLIVNGFASGNYNPTMMNSREINACRDLCNSSVLFDRSGKYTNMQKILANNEIASQSFSNSVELELPLNLVKRFK